MKMAALLRTAKASVRRMSGAAPWLMLPPTSGDTVYNFYNLSDSKAVSFNAGNDASLTVSSDDLRIPVGSSHGWLAVFNKTNYNLFLTDPLSSRHINLPSISTLLSEEYLSESKGWECIRKVIISTSPVDGHGCRAMMSFGPTERLAFCVPGRSTKWTRIGALDPGEMFPPSHGLPCHYQDFVYSTRESTFFCVTKYGQLEAWDLRTPQSPQMIMSCSIEKDFRLGSLLQQRCIWQNYVVVADGGEILLVRQYIFTTDLIGRSGLIRSDGSCDDSIFRTDGSFDNKALEDAILQSGKTPFDETPSPPANYKTVGFEVYKYDREEGRLRYLEGSLDGLALFIGLNHSWAAAARDFPQLKPNSIYFTDVIEQIPEDGGHDIGIFNYQDSTFSSCYYPADFRTIRKITPSPIWFFPNLV